MIKAVLGFFIFLISLNISAQSTVIYDGQGNVIGGSHIKIKQGEPVKLVDTLSNNYFILDSTHISITAYDKTGHLMWKTDPYKDNSVKEYRTKRPVIVNFKFVTFDGQYAIGIKKGTKVIWIVYNNTQFGLLDLELGKYYWLGQD